MRGLLLVPISEAVIEGRHQVEPGPVQEIAVEPSGLTDLRTPGKKCAHGVYIPANDYEARYCYVCTPYVIRTKEDA